MASLLFQICQIFIRKTCWVYWFDFFCVRKFQLSVGVYQSNNIVADIKQKLKLAGNQRGRRNKNMLFS